MLSIPLLSLMLQETSEPDFTIFYICIVSFALIFSLVNLIALWRIFEKANEPGWTILIPLYNAIVLLRIIGRPWWYIIFAVVPGAQIVLLVIAAFGLSRSFGQNILFAFGMLVLFPILLPVLGFGKAVYVGPMGPSYG